MDLGQEFRDCPFEIVAKEEEVKAEVMEHLAASHGIEEEDVTPELDQKIELALKDTDDFDEDEEEEF